MKRVLSILSLLSIYASWSATAEVKLPKLLGDHMVLQRNMETTLWGWAENNETVSVSLNDQQMGSVVTKNGRWQLTLPAMPAGGPHKITFTGENTTTLNDVYFGDVWVASGQSNMQMFMYRVEERFPEEVANANVPLLRHFTVPRVMDFKKPVEKLSAGEWQLTQPNTVREHSAVAHFFGKKLVNEEQVPIGILAANFGGTQAECWMSEEALKPYKNQYEKAKSYQDDDYLQSIKDQDNQALQAWSDLINNADLGSNGQTPWHADIDDSNWQTLSIPGKWQEQGIQPLSGIVWFRRTITLPPEAAGKAGFLRLGTIVDADNTYINGVEVGSTGYQYPPRRYPVKAGILKAGENTITIRVRVDNKAGQFVPEMPYYLSVGEHKQDLTGDWKYQIGSQVDAKAPTRQFTPWNEPLGCYNAMMPPLFNLNIKGVIWYQGESNTGRAAEYPAVFSDLITLWREKWQQGNFPFLFVQLANFMESEPEPSDSGWAQLRFAQFKSLQVENTAMAVAIDVGNWNDLHPMDKKSVGERLALAAQALAYKKDVVYSGPLFKHAKQQGSRIILSFDHIGSGLMSNTPELGGFAIKDENGTFKWANAKIANNKVVVWHPDITAPKHVRYAWANNPDTASLYNNEGLPASPFEVQLK
jgi:sialate O-acetylesterase